MEIQSIASESDLRVWLREGWQEGRWGPLIWIEAARGGTDGAPDVIIPTPTFGLIAVELKVYGRGDTKSEKYHLDVRPPQKRIHKLLYESHQRSAFCAADLGCNPQNRNSIGVAGGNRVSSARDGMERIQALLQYRVTEVKDLRALLNDARFWRFWR